MNTSKVIGLLRKVMKGDDWVLTEMEEGLILLQLKSNKAKGRFTNLRSR